MNNVLRVAAVCKFGMLHCQPSTNVEITAALDLTTESLLWASGCWHYWLYLSSLSLSNSSCSFCCKSFLSGSCVLYSETIVGERLLLKAYSTTSQSLSLHNKTPMLGFSFGFFNVSVQCFQVKV